jgi:mannose-1-phosphate guanylyltransferase
MLEHVVEHLSAHGITEVVLSMGHEPSAFIDAYPKEVCAGLPLKYVVESMPLDTAGAIAFAATKSGTEETFLVCNGDVITETDVRELANFHKNVNAEATISLTPVEDPSRYGIVPTDNNGKVTGFIEKPPGPKFETNLINAGYYIMEPSLLERIPGDRRVSVETEIFPELVEDEKLYAVPSETYWIDAGTPETFLKANLDLLTGIREKKINEVHDQAWVSPNAVVKSSVIGKGVKIEDGAYIENSVLMEGSEVEKNVRIEGSIVGERAIIEESSQILELTIVNHEEIVEKGSQLRSTRLPETAD